jgi:hypothetical protein
MGIRRLAFVLPLVLLSAAASAHEHNAEAFVAASYLGGSSLWGLHTSVEWVHHKDTADHQHAATPWGLVGDASVYSENRRVEGLVLGGGRFTRLLGDRTTFSIEALAGFGVSDGYVDDGGYLAGGAGVGLEHYWRKANREENGLRLEVGYICRATGDKDCHVRASAGVVIRYYSPLANAAGALLSKRR